MSCYDWLIHSAQDSPDCAYHNCTQTAYQNYQDGLIDGDMLAEFYDVYCRNSANSCLESN